MKALREKHLAQVADNLSYFNDCKTSFAISECKSWINKIFDDVEALQQPKSCECFEDVIFVWNETSNFIESIVINTEDLALDVNKNYKVCIVELRGQ